MNLDIPDALSFFNTAAVAGGRCAVFIISSIVGPRPEAL